MSHCFLLTSGKFVVDAAKPLAQVKHRIVLAREQRVHAQARLRGQFLEAAALDLVRDEHVALLVGELVQGRLELFEQHVSRVGRLGSGVGRRKQVFEQRTTPSSPATGSSVDTVLGFACGTGP